MINWERVLRTAIQSGVGAGASLVYTIQSNFSKDSIITASIGFIATVLTAVFMNIDKQVKEGDSYGDL